MSGDDIRRAVYWKLELVRRAGVKRVSQLRGLVACEPAGAGQRQALGGKSGPAAAGGNQRQAAAPSGGTVNQQTRSWAAQMAEQLRAKAGQASSVRRSSAPAVQPTPATPATQPAADVPATRQPAATPATQAPAAASAAQPPAEQVATPATSGKQLPPLNRQQRPPTFEADLQALRLLVSQCVRCPQLAATRTQTVFSDGTPQAELMMIGEAPGEDEDLQGVPFVGRSGKLLTDIITKGMLMRREDIYICNIIKCRPPGNRNPNPDEAANCRQYLEAQIELVRPRVILCLGGVATKFLLDDDTAVGKMRGRWHNYRGIDVRVTYHPSYLLRNYTKDARKLVWEDVLEVVSQLKTLSGKA